MIRIGCLGAARIAPPALVHPARVRGDAVLRAVAARDLSRAQAFAAQHGFAEAVGSYAELVTHPEIDLVYNALPISLHASWTIAALEAGKHVLCEKPFAMNAAEAEAMDAAARAAGKRLIEAFHYRYHPAFRQLLDWIAEDRIGEVRSIDAVFDVAIPDRDGAEIRHLPETGGGAFMDLGCYPLSWTLAILNAAPESVQARATLTPRGVDETMRAELVFPGGVVATLSASMARDAAFSARLRVVGARGEIDFVNPLAPHRGARLEVRTPAGAERAPIDRTTTYAHQLAAVLDALASGAPLPTEGARVLIQQRALDRIYEAAGLGALRRRS